MGMTLLKYCEYNLGMSRDGFFYIIVFNEPDYQVTTKKFTTCTCDFGNTVLILT